MICPADERRRNWHNKIDIPNTAMIHNPLMPQNHKQKLENDLAIGSMFISSSKPRGSLQISPNHIQSICWRRFQHLHQVCVVPCLSLIKVPLPCRSMEKNNWQSQPASFQPPHRQPRGSSAHRWSSQIQKDVQKEAKMWVFPKIGVPQNGWFIMENPIKDGWFGGKTHYFRVHIHVFP